MIILSVIKHTPIYVWALLALLIWRGINAGKANFVDLKQSFLMPLIFVAWGLEKLVSSTNMLQVALIAYFGAALMGTALGYLAYKRFRPLETIENKIYKQKSNLPLAIILINFLVKYILIVITYQIDGIDQTFAYVAVYALACGLSVGLFFGGILQVYFETKQLALNKLNA